MGHERENLSGYLDGALSEAERGRVAAHLSGCAECRAELEYLRAVARLVQGLPQKPLPTGFLQRLENRRERQAGPEAAGAIFSTRNLAWAVCAVTVMFVTYQTVKLEFPPPAQNASADAQRLVSGEAGSAVPSSGPMEELRRKAAFASSGAYRIYPSGAGGLSGGMSALHAPGRGAGSASGGQALDFKGQGAFGMARRQLDKAFTTSDLVARAKEQSRAEGLAATGAEPFDNSAAGLSAPVTPRGFGGQALGEAAPAAPAYTNEALHQDLELQKARMGIKRIIPPAPPESKTAGAVRGSVTDSADVYKLEASPAPAPVPGRTADLLAPSALSGAPAGSPYEGSNAHGPRLAKKSKAPGKPILKRAAPGQVVYSMEDMALLWREGALPGAMPQIDFSRQMLVVVLGQARIASVAAASDRILVRYRLLAAPPSPEQRWRVLDRSELPVTFQKLP